MVADTLGTIIIFLKIRIHFIADINRINEDVADENVHGEMSVVINFSDCSLQDIRRVDVNGT